MHQCDATLVHTSNLSGNCVVNNQCDLEDYAEYPTKTGFVRMYFNRQRGLTRSRNLATSKAQADICLICDDDEVFVANYEQAILDAYLQLP